MICITHNIANSLHDFIIQTNPDKIFLLCDAETRIFCLPQLSDIQFHHIIEVPSGESAKTLHVCDEIWKDLAEHGATRNSMLICLGGGSITDLGGFIAATYQRGIAVCYLPTTLLCMVDAGIGGKNAINLGSLKNYIGTFRLPSAIFIHPAFLSTLPETEWINGKAEIIKHALLSGNGWKELRQNGFPENNNIQGWTEIISSNTQYKEKIITADFTENNIRARLNFGHTAAHALEYLYSKNENILAHGRAVAAGMIIETMAAEALRLCKPELTHEIKAFVLTIFGRVEFNEADIPVLNHAASKDKKSQNGNLVCSLISAPGKPCEPIGIAENVMIQAWLRYLYETA
ncbi:MAG: 3-dehydroquinate synthase [Bacteroidota bacterium]